MEDNPIFSGAMQGINLIQALKDLDRGDEVYKRGLLRENALNSIHQADAQMRMLRFGRPLDASGNVSYELNSPAQMRGVPGFMPEVSVERPVNQERIASLTGFDGQNKGNYELMTPEDLNSRDRGFKSQDLMQELMMRLNLSEGQQSARARGQMQVADHKNELANRNIAVEPTVDPSNIGGFKGGIPLSKAGAFAALANAILPRYAQTTNRETGDVSYTGVDRLSGTPQTVNSPDWKGVAKSRPRVAPGTKGGGKVKEPLTVTQAAASAVERILTENKGGNIDDAIRNAEQFYKDDPDLKRPGVRQIALSKLKTLKRSESKGSPVTRSAAPAAANPSSGSGATLRYNPQTGQLEPVK